MGLVLYALHYSLCIELDLMARISVLISIRLGKDLCLGLEDSLITIVRDLQLGFKLALALCVRFWIRI